MVTEKINPETTIYQWFLNKRLFKSQQLNEWKFPKNITCTFWVSSYNYICRSENKKSN